MMATPPDYIDLIISDYLGVLIGSAVTMVGGIIAAVAATTIPVIMASKREERLRSNRASYLAARIVCILDMFILECYRIVGDKILIEKGDSFFEDDVPVELIFSARPIQTLPNVPEFPEDVDWKSIDSKLAYKIFRLRNFIQFSSDATKRSEDSIDVPLDHYFYLHEARWYSYSRVALAAIEVISELVEKHKISEENGNMVGALKQKTVFSGTMKDIEKSRKKRPGWAQKFEQQILDATKKHQKSGNPTPQPNKDEGE